MIDKKNILNCYLEEFNDLYFRNIDKMKVKELGKLNKKCFVKPYDNNTGIFNFLLSIHIIIVLL